MKKSSGMRNPNALDATNASLSSHRCGMVFRRAREMRPSMILGSKLQGVPLEPDASNKLTHIIVRSSDDLARYFRRIQVMRVFRPMSLKKKRLTYLWDCVSGLNVSFGHHPTRGRSLLNASANVHGNGTGFI